MQNDRAKFKNVVRGFSLVLHDPEGSHYKIWGVKDFPAITKGKSLRALFTVVVGSPLLSLRAEGVAIPAGREIVELVPNEMRNLLLRVCFGYASQPLPLLAMTGGDVNSFRRRLS